MSSINRTQLVTTLSMFPEHAGAGVVYLGAASDDAILRRPSAGSARYVVAQEGASAGIVGAAGDAIRTVGRLHKLGIAGGSVSLLAASRDGLRLYLVEGQGFGDTPGLSGGDMAAKMAQMSLQFLALQQATQMESRRFQTISNASKARHDVALSTIRNYR